MGRIAIVEDDAAICEAFSLLLEINGYKVDIFMSAGAFLTDAPVDTYDCLVLDMNLPGLNGIELLELLRARNIHVPAIFVTGRADPNLETRARKAGAGETLAKPVTEQTLIAGIESVRTGKRPDASART